MKNNKAMSIKDPYEDIRNEEGKHKVTLSLFSDGYQDKVGS